MEEVLLNSAALLEWPRAACKADDPAQVRGWSCPSPTRPAASPTAQRTPSSWAAAELFLVPWLLTVLVLPAPPCTLEGTVLARPRLWPLLELPSCRRALRLSVSRLAPQCHMVLEGIG